MKKLISMVLAVVLSATSLTNVFADDDIDNLPIQEQADTAGAYFGEIIKYIKENYVVGDVDTEKLMQAAIRAVVGELDSYSDYLTPEEYELVKKSEKTVWYAPEFKCDFSGGCYPII